MVGHAYGSSVIWIPLTRNDGQAQLFTAAPAPPNVQSSLNLCVWTLSSSKLPLAAVD